MRPLGPDTWELGVVLVRSERFRRVTLARADLASVRVQQPLCTYRGDGSLLKLGLQAYALGIAYEFDPYFGLSISRVDPLPHQLEAVYDHLLTAGRVRFLLADDAGAGKTVMAGLLIRELKLRGLAERILVVCPANLAFQWQRELKEKFDEKFIVLRGGDIRDQFGVRVNEIFGQTEMNYVIGGCSRVFDPKPGAVGRPYPGHRIALLDDARELAEEKRQLYVALTRAKRTLVLSWFRRRRRLKSGEVSDTIGKSLLAPIAFAEPLPARLAPLVEVIEPDVSAPPPPRTASAPAFPVDLDAERPAAEARLARARATASRPLRRSGEKGAPGTPRPPAGEDAPGSPEDLPSLERHEEVHEAAVRLGTAVHEAMEALLDPARTPPSSAAEAIATVSAPLDGPARAEAVRLVERLLAHPVVARARAARRRFVELPILFRDDALDGAPLVEGKIDLLFEEEGGWVVVDWKTDRLPTPAVRAEREALYAPQLASYARALVALLGPGTRVRETLLAFARG